MSSSIIKIKNLSKQYRIGEREGYKTIRDTIAKLVKEPITRKKASQSQNNAVSQNSEMIWALNDVSFDVKRGEIIGVIGRNGAGKSTLLKILSKITVPTLGRVEIIGRVGSLLEIGTGFHPELTGHENIYLYGAILGMDRWEVTRKFDEIVNFAEIEKFIETPVKRYSSGMYMRLAFAVAAHLETEILLVDEVLAVGDIAFQKKCIGKMEDVSSNGRTVLFVSHNMGAIRNLCQKAIWIESGKIGCIGKVDNVISQYENTEGHDAVNYWCNPNDDEKTQIANIEKIEIVDINDTSKTEFISSESIVIKFTVDVRVSNPNLKLGFDLIKQGEIVFRSQQVDSPKQIDNLPIGKNTLLCEIPSDLLNSGEYFIVPQFSVHLVKSLIKEQRAILKFRIKLDASRSEFHFVLNERNHPGSVFPLLNWELK